MTWMFLSLAIVAEVSATLSLRMMAVGDGAGKRGWLVPIVAGYVLSYVFLSFALAGGMPLGVAYGVWTAAGVALTAVAGRVLFREVLSSMTVLGIALIMGGILLIDVSM